MLACLWAGAAASAPGQGAVVPQALLDKAATNGQVPVIIRLDIDFRPEGNRPQAEVDAQRAAIHSKQQAVLATLNASNPVNVKQYKYVPYLAATVSAAGLKGLVHSPHVLSVEEDMLFRPTLAESVPLIRADKAWAGGYDGSGIAVAILDSGVDKNHNFLAGKVVSEACYSTTDSYSNTTSVCPGGVASSTASGSGVNCSTTIDGCAHGTHVAGIAAGADYTGGPGYSGVARGANIIAIQVFSELTSGCFPYASPCLTAFDSDIILGLERVYELRVLYHIAAVNMSLGNGAHNTANCDSEPEKPIIDNLRAAGIATIVSAGNDSYVDAISAPACISSAVSVGSTCDAGGVGAGCSAADDIADYSNIAPFVSLLAPGSAISSSIPGTDTFATWHGTSMAAPQVTGAWAIMKQLNLTAGVDEVLADLRASAVDVDDNRYGGTVTGLKRIRFPDVVGATLFKPPFIAPTGGETFTGGTDVTVSWQTPVVTTFSDDIETVDPAWWYFHWSGNSDWTIDSGFAHSGTQAFFASDPATISDQVEVSPAVVLPVGAELSFWHSYNTEPNYDGGQLRMTTDGGVSTFDLGPHITQNGYNGIISANFGSPIAGGLAFTGNSNGYLQTRVDLSDYTNQTARLAFRMTSDNSTSGNGWHVDDVAIQGHNPPETVYKLDYTAQCRAGGWAYSDWELNTAGWVISHDAAGVNVDWTWSTGSAHSGTHYMHASDPAAASDQYLTQQFGVSFGGAAGQLVIWHSYNTEPGFDGGVIEISADGVNNWVDAGGLMTRNGYNGAISTSFSSPIAGQAAFTGNSGGYVDTWIDVTDYAESGFFIRFRMVSDDSVSGYGWDVDDVVNVIPASWTPVGLSAPGAQSLTWHVPTVAGNDYCLRLRATATGQKDSLYSMTIPFTVSFTDSDGDGVQDFLDPDPNNVDADGDGLVDGYDGYVPVASLPGGIDLNGDGFVDGELDYGLDPLFNNRGDVVPRGSPDNQINLGDLLVLQRLVLGLDTPSPLEMFLGDLNLDGMLNEADVLLLSRLIMNL